jgi:tetratricopeptide (TPR) repeat protein
VGLLREGQGDYEGALAAYERALELGRLERVGVSATWLRVGQIYQLRVDPRRYPDAEDAYETALAMDDFRSPRDEAWVHARMAQLYAAFGRDKATVEAEIGTALQLYPEDPWIHVVAGDLYLQAKRTKDAEGAFLNAWGVAPGFEAAQIRLDRLKAKP